MKIHSDFVEFDVYDEILNGRLRSFFADSISDQEINNIINELTLENIADSSKSLTYENISYRVYDKKHDTKIGINSTLHAHREIYNKVDARSNKRNKDYLQREESGKNSSAVIKINDYDAQSGQIQELKEEIFRDQVESEISKIIGFDSKFELNQKTERFQHLIQNEFKKIIHRILELKRALSDDNRLKIVVNHNIERAKKLAGQAAELSSFLRNEDSKEDNPNSYLVDMVRNCLINSIRLYQLHLGAYIDQQIMIDDLLSDLYDERKPSWPIIKRLEESQGSDMDEHAKSLKPISIQTPFNSKKNGNRLVLKGDFWEIAYCGNETNIKNLERTKYIARLLDKPNEEYYCHELISLVKGDDPDKYFTILAEIDPSESENETESRQGRINLVNPIEDEISSEDLEAYIDRADELWQQAKDSNIPDEKREETKKNWRRLQSFFCDECGILFYETKNGKLRSKKMRRLKREFEKCRINVRKQISHALSDIRKKDPSFAKYLKNHIQTGIKCVFRPDPIEKPWTVDWGK